MDKEKAKKTIQKRTCEKIGADSVEVLPPSACDPVGLPEDHGSMINNAVYDFLTYEIPEGAQSIKGINQMQFKALCMYVGKKVNKPFVSAPRSLDIFASYSIDTLQALYPVWAYWVAVGGFVPFLDDFMLFCGVGMEYIYSTPFQSSPIRAEFATKIKRFQESGLASRLVEMRGNPTGILALLNHSHGWTTATADGEKKQIVSASVASLPDLSSDIVQSAQ